MDRSQNNFDLLRLFAAWLVLFNHCYPLSGAPHSDPYAMQFGIDTLGGVGVSIFFTLSGYLVTLSYQRTASVADFVWRRVRRIYPALIFCIGLCAFLLGPLLSTLSTSDYFNNPQTLHYLYTATAWKIQYVLPGVFADTPLPHAVNGSLWSLPYEIACYLTLLVIAICPGSLKWKALAAALVLLVWLIMRPLPPATSPFESFGGIDYYTTKLGLQFALGACVALWPMRRLVNVFVTIVAVLGFLIALSLPHSTGRDVLYILSLPILVLAIGLHLHGMPKWPSRLGDWSYGLFLWGFPVQQVLAQRGFVSEFGFAPYVLASSIISLLMAALSWFLVEKRANALAWPFAQTKQLNPAN